MEAAMPCFYFHLGTAHGLNPDGIGLELRDAETAYLEAFRTFQDMWADLPRKREDSTRYTFEITDSLGQMIQALPFSEVLDSTRGHTVRRKLPHPTRTAQELADWIWCLAAALDEQVRLARERIRHSQELLSASRSNKPRLDLPWQAHPDGESQS